MKEKELVAIPATTEARLVKVTCDLCVRNIPWSFHGSFDEVSVCRIEGFRDYECGHGDGHKTAIDMCVDCFEEKLLPWLAEFGCKPITEEWEDGLRH